MLFEDERDTQKIELLRTLMVSNEEGREENMRLKKRLAEYNIRASGTNQIRRQHLIETIQQLSQLNKDKRQHLMYVQQAIILQTQQIEKFERDVKEGIRQNELRKRRLVSRENIEQNTKKEDAQIKKLESEKTSILMKQDFLKEKIKRKKKQLDEVMANVEKQQQKIDRLTTRQHKQAKTSVLPSTALKSLQMNIMQIK